MDAVFLPSFTSHPHVTATRAIPIQMTLAAPSERCDTHTSRVAAALRTEAGLHRYADLVVTSDVRRGGLASELGRSCHATGPYQILDPSSGVYLSLAPESRIMRVLRPCRARR